MGKDSNFESYDHSKRSPSLISPQGRLQEREIDNIINVEIARLTIPEKINTPNESEGGSFRLIPTKVEKSPEKSKSPQRRVKYSPDKENFASVQSANPYVQIKKSEDRTAAVKSSAGRRSRGERKSSSRYTPGANRMAKIAIKEFE
jgi:hypothetical protein